MRLVFIFLSLILTSCGDANLSTRPATDVTTDVTNDNANHSNNTVITPTPVVEDKNTNTTEPTINPPASNNFCQVQKIFESNCVGCHNDGGRRPNLTAAGLKSAVNEEYHMGKYWIKAGSPDVSKVFTEIESGSMPRNASPLNSADVALIKTWIKDGARTSDCP